MMRTSVLVDDAQLNEVREELATQLSRFKSNYQKLEGSIDTLLNTGYKGENADQLKSKYEEKKPAFEEVSKKLEKFEGRINNQTRAYKTTLGNIGAAIK